MDGQDECAFSQTQVFALGPSGVACTTISTGPDAMALVLLFSSLVAGKQCAHNLNYRVRIFSGPCHALPRVAHGIL